MQLVRDTDEDLVVPILTLVEIDYWLRKRGAGETWQTFMRELGTGEYRLHAADDGELARAAGLEAQYESLPLGIVDASVIVACERLEETKVATLDRRHFSVVRPRHCDALTLLPE